MTPPQPVWTTDAFPSTERGESECSEAIAHTTSALFEQFIDRNDPYSGVTPETLAEELESEILCEQGACLERVLDTEVTAILAHSVATGNPRCAAHLQCPPVIPGILAELVIAVTNQSLDSFDQAPAATILEQRVVASLCELFELPETADGVFTSGGTQSNFQALLLARDRYCHQEFDHDVQEHGLPPERDSLRILCSEEAHFTVEQSAHHLGLGERAVVTVPTDDRRRMDPRAVDSRLAELEDRGLHPFAIVGTAGTTDFGSIDPLPAIADRAAARDLWFHVDAAYGGALKVSDTHGHLLQGIGRATSITVDFHKLFFQPISCGTLLLRRGRDFEWMARNAAYLNPEDHDRTGIPNLVAKSVQTTRRFDALKPYLTFRTIGRQGLATLVDRTLELTETVGALIDSTTDFELLHEPTLTTIVFRYRPEETMDDQSVGELNAEIRRQLLQDGRVILARTTVDGVTSLKFTLLNPTATIDDFAEMLDIVRECGRSLSK